MFRLPAVLPSVAMLAVLASAAVASDSFAPLDDLRLSVGAVQRPAIDERVAAPDQNGQPGARANYDWRGHNLAHLRATVSYLSAFDQDPWSASRFVWGLEVFHTQGDITPDSYRTSAGNFANSRADLELRHREYGTGVVLGWASDQTPTIIGDFHWEVLPYLHGGWATAQTVSPGFTSTREGGGAPFWEVGTRVGLWLHNEQWLSGIELGTIYSEAHIDIDLGSTGTSTVSLIRRGLLAQASIGYRF
jgi:opacity protein-like surface antigen